MLLILAKAKLSLQTNQQPWNEANSQQAHAMRYF